MFTVFGVVDRWLGNGSKTTQAIKNPTVSEMVTNVRYKQLQESTKHMQDIMNEMRNVVNNLGFQNMLLNECSLRQMAALNDVTRAIISDSQKNTAILEMLVRKLNNNDQGRKRKYSTNRGENNKQQSKKQKASFFQKHNAAKKEEPVQLEDCKSPSSADRGLVPRHQNTKIQSPMSRFIKKF